METAFEKLLRIHQLWKELERMKPDTSESEVLMKKLRVLSAEYQTLTEGQSPSANIEISHCQKIPRLCSLLCPL